jgi:ligand-binding sensor domain-containing protein
LRGQTPVFRQTPLLEIGNARLSCVVQDSRGWLWCGAAEGGLFRFDGQNFQPVGLPDTLKRQNVTTLAERAGVLWVGFSGGAIGSVLIAGNFPPALTGDPAEQQRYAPRLTLWQPEEGLPTRRITAFAEDATGGWWIGTYGEGLYLWKEGRFFQFNRADDGLASDDIYALACDAQGRIWAGTDAGVSICAMPSKGQKIVQNIGIANGLPDEIITTLKPDNQGNIWLGTQQKGICRFDPSALQCTFRSREWAFGSATDLSIFGSRELWVGTEGDGLIRVDLSNGNEMPLPDAHPLRHAKIHSLCKDREGLLWMVADKGVLCSANVRFGLWELGFQDVQALLIDRQSRFWVGSQAGLFVQNGGFSKDFQRILPQNVISIWESPQGEIWAGTFGDGVFVCTPDGRKLRHLGERDGLANGSVLSIAGDGERVWLATLGGVEAVDAHTMQRLKSPGALPDLGRSYVYKVLRDRSGRVWFGTDGKGLAMLENGNLRFFTEAKGVPIKTVYCIAEDLKGNLWFSSDQAGLFCFDGLDFQHFTTKNGLHSQRITGLAVDGNGLIVVGYEDGFDLLNPTRRDHISFCDARVGAPAASVNLNALCRDAQGNVWLGCKQGIVRAAAFDEAFLDDPQPGITAVSVLMQPVDFLRDNDFSHDQNYLIFNFTGLWYTHPESVRYRYRLEGFDPDWKVSKDHLASYPNLPPGRYTFRVQTSEHGNFERVPEAAWSFVVRRPWWQRWWFVLLAGGATLGAFLAFVRARERRLRREARLKRDLVESQFEALKSQINPHFLFNSFNTLIAIIEENPHIAVQYVEHLSDFYRNLMAYRERDFISIQEEMSLVRSFDFLLKKRYEAGFQLVENLNGQPGQVMPLALQMLVENAVKHNIISASKPLVVEIKCEPDGYISVRNNLQKKIKPEPSTRFGLQSLVQRYRLLGLPPVLVTDDGQFFTVKVPIRF